MGLQVRTFWCGGCRVKHVMTVHADGRDDPRVMDRFRLLARSQQWVIDFDGQAWCPKHKGMAAC